MKLNFSIAFTLVISFRQVCEINTRTLVLETFERDRARARHDQKEKREEKRREKPVRGEGKTTKSNRLQVI